MWKLERTPFSVEDSAQEGMTQLLSVGAPSWCNAAPGRGTRSATQTRVAARYLSLQLYQSLPAQASHCVCVVVQ